MIPSDRRSKTVDATEREPRELERDEFRRLLELRVQGSLGMSLSEFIRALREGRLDPESPKVAGLAILVGARAH
jgi:hypothetical protein